MCADTRTLCDAFANKTASSDMLFQLRAYYHIKIMLLLAETESDPSNTFLILIGACSGLVTNGAKLSSRQRVRG